MSDSPQLSAIFSQVLQAPPAKRHELVRRLCADKPEWVPVIEQLVDAALRAPQTDEWRRQVITDAPALPPGTRIGQYEIEAEIARGGMGVVYRARDLVLPREVAIKAVKPEIAHDPAHVARLQAEARLLARLSSHPNIAMVLQLIVEDGATYIVQELLTGQSLRARLENGPMSVRAALGAASHILAALGAAHEAGIVHRDLKPENVVCTSSGVYKVLDFGIAKRESGSPVSTFTSLTAPGQIAGTLRYMSPEQLTGGPVGPSSDLFSFGVLLYELLTGRLPFPGSDNASVWSAILGQPPAPFTGRELAEIPPHVIAVIARCLEKNPHARWQRAQDVAVALETAQPFAGLPPAPDGDGDAEEDRRAVGWWQFHEAAAAIVAWLLLIPVWHVRPWVTVVDWRVLFFVLLGTLSVVPSLRLSLVFAARNQPARVQTHHERCAPWIRWGDILFTLTLVATGISIAGAHDGWATLLIAFGIGTLVISTFVEPLTTREALEALARNPRLSRTGAGSGPTAGASSGGGTPGTGSSDPRRIV